MERNALELASTMFDRDVILNQLELDLSEVRSKEFAN